jgi:hypothetical protein
MNAAEDLGPGAVAGLTAEMAAAARVSAIRSEKSKYFFRTDGGFPGPPVRYQGAPLAARSART